MAETDAQCVATEQCEKAAIDAEVERAHQAERVIVVSHTQALTTSLHAQAVAVQNFRALMSSILDRLSKLYNQWHGLFLNALGKYALTDHVFLNVTPTDAAN
jgi:hypothetical protein